MPVLDVFRGATDLVGGVVEKRLLLLWSHFPEQVTRLLPVIVVHAVIPVGSSTSNLERLVERRLVGPFAPAIGKVCRRYPEVAVSAHCAVAVITVERTFRCVDRDVMVIDPEPIALCISIGEQSSLQHLVGRIANARHDVGGRERRLFDFGEDVFGVSIKLKMPDLDQRAMPLTNAEIEAVINVLHTHAIRFCYEDRALDADARMWKNNGGMFANFFRYNSQKWKDMMGKDDPTVRGRRISSASMAQVATDPSVRETAMEMEIAKNWCNVDASSFQL